MLHCYKVTLLHFPISCCFLIPKYSSFFVFVLSLSAAVFCIIHNISSQRKV